MKVFVTGTSGFIGSAVVKDLISAGYQAIGLARSEVSAKAIKDAGAETLTGSLEDLEILKQGALQADGVIHTAFIHDFTQYAKASDGLLYIALMQQKCFAWRSKSHRIL